MDYLTVVGSPAVKLELNPSRQSDDDRKLEAGDKPGQFRPEPDEWGRLPLHRHADAPIIRLVALRT